MPKFTDADGREWHFTLTLAEIKQVRTELDVDLLDVGGKDLFERLVNDPVLIVDILHVVLQQECQARGLDSIGFARGLRGDAIDDASRALLEALVDFFPQRRRAVLQAAVNKTNHWLEKSADHALTVIESPRMDQLLEAALAQTDRTIEEKLAALSGRRSPNGGASPECTPSE